MLNLNELIGFGAGGMGAALYWRVLWTEPSTVNPATGLTNAECSELEMRDVSGGVNLCTGGTPFASSSTSGDFPVSEAFNGSGGVAGDYWKSNAPALGEYIGYQFSAPVVVTEFTFYPSYNLYVSRPKGFALERSDNGLAWERVQTWTGLSFSTSPQTFTVTA